MLLRKPDAIRITANGDKSNTFVSFEESESFADIYVKSKDKLRFVTLRWNFRDDEKRKDNIKILSDAWERGYGYLAWRGIEPERVMPWYIAVSDGSDKNRDFTGRFTECFGVEVQPSAMCFWQYDDRGVTLNLDVRNGGAPVELGGRTLRACRVFFRDYHNCSAFDALKEFCAVMCPDPLKYDGVIYGSNNWYYAYGNSSKEEIIFDSELIAELCDNLENRPFMVIDDGWQPNSTNPPWVPGDKFGDMKVLADKMKEKGVTPGIWVRFLSDEKFALTLPDEARRGADKKVLDPTHPEVIKHIENTVKYIISCGYKLIKHDYSANDISGKWGPAMGGYVCAGEEGFYDKSKTTAEIYVDFCRLILKNSGDAVILACNCFSHLTAGLCHINRVGDDTSGTSWERTRKMGVNSLVFRLCQNNNFYVVDADCVGIMGRFNWNLNRKWLKLVANSGTSLFVSCKPSEAKGQTYDDLKEAYVKASVQKDELIPLDWMENNYPSEYLINGEYTEFNWYTETGADTIQ